MEKELKFLGVGIVELALIKEGFISLRKKKKH